MVSNGWFLMGGFSEVVSRRLFLALFTLQVWDGGIEVVSNRWFLIDGF